MKARARSSVRTQTPDSLPVHSLEQDSLHINILPLDHRNPYDYKREHRHTYFEIMLIEKGGGNQLIDFKNYPALQYSCYMICPQQVHLMNRNNSTGTVLQFTEDRITSPELRASLKQWAFYENPAVVFENRPDAWNDFQSILLMMQQVHLKTDPVSYQAVSHLLQALVSLLLLQGAQKGKMVVGADKKLLLDFYYLLETQYGAARGVQYFAEQLQTTEKKLAAATKKHAGLSPLQVIHNRIVLEAKRLLLFEELSHKEIAYQLGFDSPASFSAFIKTKTGHSPSELTSHLAEIHK